MNIPLKQHLPLKESSPTTGLSCFIKRIRIDAVLSRVEMLLRLKEEQEEHPDDEPMPPVVALLLRRVDELAEQHMSLEQCINQIEREREWTRQKRNRQEEVTHRECLRGRI